MNNIRDTLYWEQSGHQGITQLAKVALSCIESMERRNLNLTVYGQHNYKYGNKIIHVGDFWVFATFIASRVY